MSNCTVANAKDVVQWINTNTGYWEPSLELKASPLGGVGVFATRAMDPLDEPVLLRLHKDSLLSPMKSCIANLLTDGQIDGMLALSLAFIYEREQGDKSPWAAYIKSIEYSNGKELILPPSLWSKAKHSLLQGTELAMMGGLDEEEMQQTYELACSFALSHQEHVPLPYEFDIIDKDDAILLNKYQQYVAIVNQIASRDFEIDQFHEVALCPGADLFNHSVRNNVRFESLFDVCGQCGESVCDHMVPIEDGEHDGGDTSDSGEDSDLDLDEVIGDDDDKLNGEDSNEDAEDEEEAEEPEFEGTIEEFIEVIETAIEEERNQEPEKPEVSGPQLYDEDHKPIDVDNCCDIVLQHKVQLGDELFNTYGDYNSSILLTKYGFVIPGNANDQVGLGMQFLKLKKKKQYSAAFAWWDSEGYAMMRDFLSPKGCDDDDCGGCGHDDDHDDGPNGCGDAGCEDDCCGSESPSWTMEVILENSGEPSPMAYSLCKLLSLNNAEFQKLIKGKPNSQLLTTSSSKAYKLLLEIVKERSKVYTDAPWSKMLKSKDIQLQMIAQLVSDEQTIISKATKYITKRT